MWPKPAGRARLKGSLPVISVLLGNSLSTTVTTTGIVIDTTLFCCRKKEILKVIVVPTFRSKKQSC